MNVAAVKERLAAEPPDPMTGAEYLKYEAAIERTFGETVPPRRGPGRPRGASRDAGEDNRPSWRPGWLIMCSWEEWFTRPAVYLALDATELSR